MPKQKTITDPKEILKQMNDENSDEDGHTEGSNFICSVCDTCITIKNAHCMMGDRTDCKICDLPACENCTIECLHCEDKDICITCSVKCNGCSGYICNEDDCVDMLNKCKKCKLVYCAECNINKCACKKKMKKI